MKLKKMGFIILTAVFVLASLIQPATAADKKLKFAMVVHDITSPFQAFFKIGGEDAAKLCGVDFDFMGTTQIDIPNQVAMFENVVQSGYDGIAVTIFDPAAFAKGIQAAKDKNIVVASFNIDGDWGKRSTFAYSGSDMYQQGYELGKYFFKEVMQGKGKYILVPAIADLDVLVLRMDGIKKAAEAYPDIQFLRTVEIGTDLAKAYSVVENAYTANPDVTAFIGTDFFSESMANFISVRRLKGKVFGACFDITPGILKHLNSGAIQCTSDQNPYLQGFYAIMQMYLYLAKNQPGQEINTGSTLVTKDNMGPFLDYYGMGD